MTKKRVGTIYGSPIIEGDKNLKTSNEIHVSELGGGGEGNNSGIEDKRYYTGDLLDSSVALRSVIFGTTKAISGYEPYKICSIAEVATGGGNINVKAIELDFNYFMDYPISSDEYFRGTLKQYLEYMSIISTEAAETIKQLYSLPTITKEEFYALSKVEPINK